MIEEFIFENLCEEEVQANHNKDSLPKSILEHIPHFLVELMNFLKSLKVIVP